MGDPKSQQAKNEAIALHAALLRKQKEDGTLGTLIPTEEWESILAKTLGVATRQTAQDKTWFLQRLTLIERRHKEGVIILDRNVTPT